MERVAALFRDQVDPDASAGRVRCASAGLVHHLLAPGVVQITLDGAISLQPVDDHPVHEHRGLCGTRAVHGEVRLLHGLRPADVGYCQRNADDQLPHRLQRVGVRHRIEDIPREHRRPRVGLHIDDGRLARDGDSLFQ